MFNAEIDWFKAAAVLVIGGAVGALGLYIWNRTAGKKIAILGPMVPSGSLPLAA